MKSHKYLPILAGLVLFATGCQTLREIASLRHLDFAMSGVSTPRLAGVDLSSVRAPEDLSPSDMLRLGSAVLRKDLPLDVRLMVSAQNPESNSVDARLVGLDWTLLLDDKETISGFTEGDILIPPGATADVPVVVSLNLIEFFDQGVGDLLDLALAVAGAGGSPTRVKLQATPTVNTVIGPIRYPNPITIASKSVGG
jgi:hypothetical protein